MKKWVFSSSLFDRARYEVKALSNIRDDMAAWLTGTTSGHLRDEILTLRHIDGYTA